MIVTFEPHSGYYHPDNLAIQRATTAAFFSSSVMGNEAPERLFYRTMLRDVFRGFADASRGRGIIDGLDPDVFATAPEMIAVSFDASPYMERKFSALAAHRSVFGVTPEMLMPATLRARRDYAMLAVLIGCGLRRAELLALTVESIQQREAH